MKCIICNGLMSYYFSKLFNEFALSNVDYFKCINCGFVASKTHFEMKETFWKKLNKDAHAQYNSIDYDPSNKPPPYFYQALLLLILYMYELIPKVNWLDYGSGLGKLSYLAMKYFNLKINNFDKYITPNYNSLEEKDIANKKYDLVISSAVFEHIRNRDTLEKINELVAENGSLAIHTLVRREIPKDPAWMYLLPVHCAFHTNSSMSILFNKWGYSCSVYCVQAKMWVFFRGNTDRVKDKVNKINKEIEQDFLHYKEGFMDYWS